MWLLGLMVMSALVFFGARLGVEYLGCKGQQDCAVKAAKVAVFFSPREPEFLDLLRASRSWDAPEEDDTEDDPEAKNTSSKFLIKPVPEDEVPDWLKDKGDGTPARTKAPTKDGLYGLKGPKAGMDPHLARRLAEDVAKNAGVLGLLRGPADGEVEGRAPSLRVTPSATVGQPRVDGAVGTAAIKQVVQKHLDGVQKCYQRTFGLRAVRAARKGPGEAREVARLGVQLVIENTGWVTAAAVRRSSSYHHDAETCLNKEMRSWRFQDGWAGKNAVADVPLVLTWNLQPAEKEGR